MQYLEYKSIPGYDSYGVTKDGIIISIPRYLILNQYLFNGYYIVDTFRGSLTETLPVHRAVALAWIPNDRPDIAIFVNHKDGNKRNNWWENLEWSTPSENVIHAISTGLRTDNRCCKIRDFETKEVLSFPSIGQAIRYMGFSETSRRSRETLARKQFGALIQGRYEFRFVDDPTPWFYENRTELVGPSRFMVTAIRPDGTIDEMFSTPDLLKKYQLYDAPSKSIPVLVMHAREKYPDHQFNFRDSYLEKVYWTTISRKETKSTKIKAIRNEEELIFSSQRHAARYFNVCRKSITHRLNKDIELNGWTLTEMDA